MGVPSSALYTSIGETTTRFASVSPRSRKGVNIGGTAGAGGWPPAARPANHRSTPATYVASRSRRFSCPTRWLRVRSEYANCSAGRRTYRRTFSNHSIELRAAFWSRSASVRRSAS